MATDANPETTPEELRRRTELDDLKWLLAHPQGCRIAWRLLALAGVFHESFNANALVMARSEGRRSLGLQLFQDLVEARPDAYSRMLTEHKPK